MQDIDLIVKNGTVVTINANMQIIENGAIAVQNGIIIEIGKSTELLPKYQAKRIIDATGQLIMPGMVNAHSHASMTVFRGYADDLPLQTWLNDYIFPAEAKYINADTARIGVDLAIVEMLRSGTTCFNDMYFFENEIAKSVHQSGMRAVLSEGILDFPTPDAPTPDVAMAKMRELQQEYKTHEKIYAAISAHAPYTCSDRLMQDTKKLAEEFNVPFHIHLAETKWEYDKYMAEHKLSPTEYVHKLGLLDSSTVAAHSVHLSENDLQLFAQQKVNAAHNPVCNMKLASGVSPVPAMQELGINVALGTDGVASNNKLDMLQEMHVAALVHKLQSNDPSVAKADSIVRMATINGAKALGLDHLIGSLEVGKRADFITINLSGAHTVPLYNVYSALVYAITGSDVCDVVVNGDILMRNKELLTVNESDILETARECTSKFVNS